MSTEHSGGAPGCWDTSVETGTAFSHGHAWHSTEGPPSWELMKALEGLLKLQGEKFWCVGLGQIYDVKVLASTLMQSQDRIFKSFPRKEE